MGRSLDGGDGVLEEGDQRKGKLSASCAELKIIMKQLVTCNFPAAVKCPFLLGQDLY